MKTRSTACFLLLAAPCLAAHLSPTAGKAFEAYVTTLESRLGRQHADPATYLAMDMDGAARTEIQKQLRSGAVRIEPVHGGTWEVTGGLMHHWRAEAFVAGADPGDMLALLRDSAHLSRYYGPEIVSSKAMPGDNRIASLIRFKKRKVITVVLDAEFEGRSELTGDSRGYSVSRSTHIWQVDRPGTPTERRRREGDDDGYLWRLNSYWSFAQAQGGLLIECEAVSLTRDIPFGLGWLVTPIIETLPRESLEFTLTATRNALVANRAKEAGDDRTN